MSNQPSFSLLDHFTAGVVCKEEEGPAYPVTEVGENSLGAVTPGETLGTLYTFGVGSNKTKQHRFRGAVPPRRQAPLQGAEVHALQDDLDAHWGG